MARHHHHSRSRQQLVAATRSMPLRVLSALALVLPAVLLIISFALAMATIFSPKWAVQDIFDQNDIRTRYHNYRAPFYDCNQTDVITDDIEKSGPNSTCRRITGIGVRGMNYCETLDPKDDHVCQQTVMAANLMVAGVVFIALAMAVSFGVLGTGIQAAIAEKTVPATTNASASSSTTQDNQHGKEAHEISTASDAASPVETVSWTKGLDAALILLGLTGSAMLLLAQVVGVNALVNDVLPNANFEEFQPNTPGNTLTYTSWYMGEASYVFISVAWLAGFLACYISILEFSN